MSLEERLTALEAEVAELRERVTDTHTLAAHADRDVAEFRDEIRAQTRLLNANRQDLTELREQMQTGFAQVGQGMAQIVAMLGRLSGDGE